MAAESAATVFDQVLDTLLAEEAGLVALTLLAEQELDALLRSDYTAINAASSSMGVHAQEIEELERVRKRLLEEVRMEDATLDVVVTAAESSGVDGFAEVRARLLTKAAELRDTQERNARLLLSAMKLQERWITMFGALSSPTYGADGNQDRHADRTILSRSA